MLLLAYAAGDSGFNLFWVLFESFAIYFYVQSYGLAISAVTPILVSARVVDLLSGLLIGIWADRTRSRLGSYRPFLLWTAVPLGLSCLCVFTGPTLWPACLQSHRGPAALFLWAAASATLFALLYSAANIAYTALLSVITTDASERVRAASGRFTAAAAAVFLVQAATLPMVSRLGNGDAALGWQRVALYYGAIGCLLLLLCFAGTREIVVPERSAPTDFRSLRLLLTDTAFLRLLSAMVFALAAFTCRGAITPFYSTYNAEHASWTSALLASNSLAALAVCSAVSVFGKRVPSARLMASLCAGSGALLCFLPGLGTMPRLSVLIALQITFGAATGMLLPALFSLFAALPARFEVRGSGRVAGLVASGSLLALKLGATVGSVLVSSLLGHLGFRAAAAQPIGALRSIHALFTYLPGGLLVLTVLCLGLPSYSDVQADAA